MASCALLALVAGAALAAPIYADEVAGTTPSDNHLSEQIEVDGEPRDIVSLTGEPIGPTWQERFLLGADENGRDLMVRLLYGIRTTVEISLGAVLLTLAFACRWRSAPGTSVAGPTRSSAASWT